MPDGVLCSGSVGENKSGYGSAFLEYTDLTETRMKRHTPISFAIL